MSVSELDLYFFTPYICYVVHSLPFSRKHVGENIVYIWVEKLRELLLANKDQNLDPITEVEVLDSEKHPLTQNIEVPKVTTGDPLTDRKSTFQAHVATITSPSQVK